ncbi:lysine--tRNA ligase [Candidatus Bipolaricaulota bacterium]|nr:lysine--tRNA ligase [Candidatus Bipolaricaulota bacterium]
MAEEILEVRQRKLERLRARGIVPYAYKFQRTHTAAELHEAYGELPPESRTGVQARIAGRIFALRRMGKIAFADLRDSSGRLQLFFSRATLGEDGYELLGELDLGDIIGAWGEVITTRTGELSLEVQGFEFLAKALRPLPEKWHGLRDPEKRYRYRELDLLTNEKAHKILLDRAVIVRTLRRELEGKGFVEVETPILQPIPGGAAARPFVTHHNALDRDLYLRIAPELYLKRLLVAGYEKVFELGKNFRNEGISTQHNPEFTALEAYEAYADYHDAMELAQDLITACVEAVHGKPVITYQGEEVNFSTPWRRITLYQFISDTFGIDPEAPLEELLAQMDRKGIPYPEPLRQGPKGKVLEHLLELGEETLWNPTFVLDYPLDISPLAKRKRGNPELVERFELFIAGKEVANAFSELNDPEEQRERFLMQERMRASGDEEAHRLDEGFLRALEHGMPPAAGIGFGVDRLVMVLTDAPSIREVIAFPLVGERA